MSAFLTIFTPSYNRAYILKKCYESLLKQTCKDFEWLIIDDGSRDNTKEIVENWITENKIKIKYIYQENQGMHGAHNTAYKNITTELNVCIDSDDYMPKDAVEIIKEEWSKIKNKKSVAGLIGLDARENGEIIGTEFKNEGIEITLFDFYNKENGQGDKKIVYRSDLTKKYPYPIFEGEKYVGLAYKYHKIDLECKLITINKVLCIVEYLDDGSSKNMLQQYRRNPNGFCFYRIEEMKNPNANFFYRFRNAIHYVSSSLIAKKYNLLKDINNKKEIILAIPLGLILYIYILYKTEKVS